jgi:uncharacterized glyoxalase superfamily protein PhnB
MPKSTPNNAASKRPEPEETGSLRLASVIPGLTVNDLEASVAWYQDVLGCGVAKRWVREGRLTAATIRAGSVDFLLQQDDFAKGRDRQKGEGLRFYLITRQDIDKLAAAIAGRGGVFAQAPTDQSWGARDFALVDPDGFKISVSTRW